VLEFPAILPSGRALWPEYWDIEELEKVKVSIGLKKWNAQWQQQPTNDEGAILKRNWWRKWRYWRSRSNHLFTIINYLEYLGLKVMFRV
jgi:hypothetical protein